MFLGKNRPVVLSLPQRVLLFLVETDQLFSTQAVSKRTNRNFSSDFYSNYPS